MKRWFIITLISATSVFGIEAQFQSESLSGYLGDVVRFGWDIIHPQEASLNFSEIDVEGTGIEVLDRTLTNIEGGSHLGFETAVYDSVGIYTFPSAMLFLSFEDTVDSLLLQGPNIEIVSVLVPSDTTFRDIKAIHHIRTPLNLIYLLYGLLLLGFIYLLYYVFKRFKKKTSAKLLQKVIVPPEEAHVIALREFESLKRSKYIRFEQFKEFYSELTHILKQYYENRYLVDALEQTTSEFLDTMRSMPEFDKQLIDETHIILQKADFIKFAKGKSDELESGKSLSQAIDLVKRTKVEMNQGDNS